MKRSVSLLLSLVFFVLLCSCTSPKDLHGAWYSDSQGVRNAIQFSENIEGKNGFIWAVYNIEEDSIESNNTGFYYISGDKIIFDSGTDSEPMELTFELNGDTLTLSSDTATLTLTRYLIEE